MWHLLACTPSSPLLTVHPEADTSAVFEDFTRLVGHPDLRVEVGEPRGRGTHVVLTTDPSLGAGAYRVNTDRGDLAIAGGDVLGLQFGLAEILESAGVRFVHPQHTRAPDALVPRQEWPGDVVVPDVARNGLHVHTLHPTEAYYDLWEPSADGLARAEQLVDWIVKNRGNHLQWPLLDEVLTHTSTTADWQAHTAAVTDYAHARGVTIGLGVQLFGRSNLQLAFDLVEDESEIDLAEIDARLAVLAPVGPDELDLSFGEFFAADPDAFVQTGNLVIERMKAAVPGVEVATTIHVGDDLRVTYDGQEMGFYFLAQHLDALPRVHTVMYYNLFEDAGGAYEHEDFGEHRAFLLDRLARGEPTGYHPESAYWVAFDDSVPTFLPLYVRSRFTDLDRIAAAGGSPLPDHSLFSTGWEWGYWLNDAATLRMAHHRPEAWGDVVHEIYGGWGDPGHALADAVVALGDLQHDALIDDRLAAYLAARDAVIDLGDSLDIRSQPDRPQLDEVGGLDPDALAALDEVVAGLDALAGETESVAGGIAELEPGDPVFDEVRDGLAIDALRARFAARVYASALALARGGDAESELVRSESLLEEARAVVARRHGQLWWAGGDRILTDQDENATIYRFGYLGKADTLCYWERERAELANLVRGTTEPVPPCT